MGTDLHVCNANCKHCLVALSGKGLLVSDQAYSQRDYPP